MSKSCYVDGLGVPFTDYRLLLPGHVADWPRVKRIKCQATVQAYRCWFDRCQFCGAAMREIHHIIGGTAGRADVLYNLISLCRTDHEQFGHRSEEALARILHAKWVADRENTSWVRLALLRRQHLPEPKAWREAT